MEREEIKDLALSELVQRSFRLMRENDPEADKAFTERTEITGRMDEYIRKCGAEAKQLYDDSAFVVGDKVIVMIQRYDFGKKQIYGKIVAKW